MLVLEIMQDLKGESLIVRRVRPIYRMGLEMGSQGGRLWSWRSSIDSHSVHCATAVFGAPGDRTSPEGRERPSKSFFDSLRLCPIIWWGT